MENYLNNPNYIENNLLNFEKEIFENKNINPREKKEYMKEFSNENNYSNNFLPYKRNFISGFNYEK